MIITFLMEQLETLKQQFKKILKISESSDLIKEQIEDLLIYKKILQL